jgi:hypothetical protein
MPATQLLRAAALLLGRARPRVAVDVAGVDLAAAGEQVGTMWKL